jgi:hypothetical protein
LRRCRRTTSSARSTAIILRDRGPFKPRPRHRRTGGYGLKKRAAALEDLDAELRGEIGSGSHSLRRHAQLMALRKKMGGVHEALRKAKR